jgi:hypothetical protein
LHFNGICRKRNDVLATFCVGFHLFDLAECSAALVKVELHQFKAGFFGVRYQTIETDLGVIRQIKVCLVDEVLDLVHPHLLGWSFRVKKVRRFFLGLVGQEL